MNRRAVLLALARSGRLTPERAEYVRLAHESDVRLALARWRVPNVVLDAADIPLRRGRTPATEDRIARACELHMLALGHEPTHFRWVVPRDGARLPLARWWELARGDAVLDVASALGIPERVARVLAHHREAAWKPLADLASRGVWVFGIGSDEVMMVAHAKEPT